MQISVLDLNGNPMPENTVFLLKLKQYISSPGIDTSPGLADIDVNFQFTAPVITHLNSKC